MIFRPRALLLLGSVLLAVAQPPGVGAQQQVPAAAPEVRTSAFRVAVFDLEIIKANAAAFKDIRRQRQELMNGFNAERQKESEALRVAEEELARQRAILSADAFTEERRKLGQKAGEADRRLQIRMHQIDMVSNNAVDVVEKALQQVVLDLVKENNISLLFTRQAVYVVAQQLDVTDEIMTLLDKRLSVVKVANPNTVKVDNPPGQTPAAARSTPAPAQTPAAGKPPAPAPAPAAKAPVPAKPAPAR